MKKRLADSGQERSEHFYRRLSDRELRETMQFYIHDNAYKPDKYTNIIRGILQSSSFNYIQRDTLITHLCKHENDFA